MNLLGLEITTVTVGIFLIVSCVFFYIIYSYLTSKDVQENDKTTIYIYSTVPSLIIGIIFAFAYEKYLKKTIGMNKQELLQEDFYS